jgi:L-arabinose isomerase
MGQSIIPDLAESEVWFLTGSQTLYGDEILAQVATQSQSVVGMLDDSDDVPCKVVWKPVLTSREAILQVILEANANPTVVGVITWMHTFSPAKMWIAGLELLAKPFLHLHTQYNREIPWADIDMDFMNLNQAAHGDREFGFIAARLRLERKVVVGHWGDTRVQEEIGTWSRAACARADWQSGRVVRIGDNMREVAVTEGDKVEAQRRFGV